MCRNTLTESLITEMSVVSGAEFNINLADFLRSGSVGSEEGLERVDLRVKRKVFLGCLFR